MMHKKQVKVINMLDGTEIWDVVKTIISMAWIPLGAYLTYKNNADNRNASWKEEIEERMAVAEANDKLHDMQIQAIKEILKDTKESIKEVKQGVDKLIDRLIK